MRRAGLPEGVPEARALLDRHVQLPAEVADVRDPRRQGELRADLERAAGAELEGLVGDVVARHRGQDVARPRAPQPDRRPRRGDVDQRGRSVLRQVVAEPLLVSHPVRAAGHDPEQVVAEPHDREVGLEAAARRQQWGVDDASDRHVHLTGGDPLQPVQGAGTGDVEDRERRQVEDAGVLAHREVLGIDDRRPPARVPLVRARLDAVVLDQRRVRLEPLRPLPARRLVEDGAERFVARVHRRQPRSGRSDAYCSAGWTMPYVFGNASNARAFVCARVFWCAWKRLMSDECRSMCDSPVTIHSATDLPTPGPSFTHTAAHDQRPFTSGVSPSTGMPSGVSAIRPLMAYFTPTDSSPTISGISSSACSICGSKSSCVNGNSVGRAPPPRRTGSPPGRAGSSGARTSRSRGRRRPGART